MINVALISTRQAVVQTLADENDINTSVVEATMLDATVQSVRQSAPDIIVMEQNIDNIDTDILCHFLSKACPAAQCIILSKQPPTFEMLQNTGFKARGYIPPEQMHLTAKAIRVIHDGEAWLPRKLVAEMLNHFSQLNQYDIEHAKPTLKAVK